jgi:hypothetical protein
VPVVLGALTSASEEDDKAFVTLCGSICHRGSVYSATPYAVPFLARIDATVLRDQLTRLLSRVLEYHSTG